MREDGRVRGRGGERGREGRPKRGTSYFIGRRIIAGERRATASVIGPSLHARTPSERRNERAVFCELPLMPEMGNDEMIGDELIGDPPPLHRYGYDCPRSLGGGRASQIRMMIRRPSFPRIVW